jgi:outer membrane protein
MKKSTLRYLFLFCGLFVQVAVAQGQTNKGTLLVGGNVDFSSVAAAGNGYGKSLFVFSPTIGYFIIDKLAMGANIDWTVLSTSVRSNNVTYTDAVGGFAIGPFARYYFSEGNIRPYANLNMGFGGASSTSSGLGSSSTSSTHSIFNVGAGLGAAFMLSDHASIDAQLKYSLQSQHYTGSSTDYSVGTGLFGLSVGLHAYLYK